MSSNSNMSYNKQLNDLTALLKDDKSPTKPKIIKKGGVFTKKFLDWNKLQIKNKKTFFYAGEDKIYNPETKRFTDLPTDKRFKKIVPKKKIKKELTNNTKTKLYNLTKTNDNYEDEILTNILKVNDGDIDKFEVDLTRINLKDLVELILDVSNFKRKLISSAVDFPDRWITLSQSNLQNLQELTQLTSQENGSDIEYLFNGIQGNGKIIIEAIYPAVKKGYEKPAGAFFNYYNLTNYDLSRYDIYNKKTDYKDNCLLIALRNSGKVSSSNLNKIKDMFRNSLIPTNKLKQIADTLNICIIINRKISGVGKTLYYGDKNLDRVNIGLVNNHYFIIENTEITRYSLEHYEEVKNEKDFHKIVGKNKNGVYERRSDRGLRSNLLIETLLNNDNLIKKIPVSDLLETQFYSSDILEDDLFYDNSLYDKKTNPSGCLKENKIPEKDNSDYYKVFYDFETNTKGDKHIPYLVCGETEDGEKFSYKGDECGKGFINHLKKFNKEHILLIAHNQRYDFTFILDYIFCLKPILKGNRLMGGSGRIYINKEKFTEIHFQDSLNLIPEKLCKFGKMFDLPCEKELMPYDLYNKENIDKVLIRKEKCLEEFDNEEDKRTFLSNCEKWNCLVRDKFVNIIKYSKKYCDIDVKLLKDGYLTFRKWIKEITGLDIVNYCSIASLANDFMIKENVYEGCYSLSGVPRAFIQRCVVGGKVMCAENKKDICYDELADYDGVSLYPSSMKRMKGVLKGEPKVILKEQLNEAFLLNQSGFFVKVMCLNNPKIKRKFPLLSCMNKEGVRNFTNETEGEIFYIDKTTYEDCKTFQGLEFKFLCGYYYNEGHNNKINETIEYLFSKRLEMKKKKNPIQAIYKLLMNSAYGKSMLKPIDSETEIIYESNWSKYLEREYNFIKEFTKSGKIYIVKKTKPISNHFNNVYFGVEVLSTSKRIMNEVMCSAEDNGIHINYTDTDSIHLKLKEVEKLEKIFLEKYGRVLNGKNLGQFHIDFDLEGATKNIRSVRSVFLGKKCYMDELKGEDDNGNEITGFHLRMKGVPEMSIYHSCETKNINPFELYKSLYEGEKVKFDLLCGGKRCNFKYDKNLSVRSLGYDENGVSEFQRELSF